jgi:hypothetical protein
MKITSMLLEKLRSLISSTKAVLADPNAKQREAYGRVVHNLAVACIIGAVTLGYSTPPSGQTYLWRIVELIGLAVVAIVFGGFLSKGE